MGTLAEARSALADAVTSAGLHCLEYPPDAVDAPLAWVDEVGIDFTSSTSAPGTFCLPGTATARITTVAQRYDSQGAIAYLEGLIPAVVQALYDIDGLIILNVDHGTESVSGGDLPTLNYLVQFHI